MRYAISSLCLVIGLTVAACNKEARIEIDPRAANEEARSCSAQGGDWRRVCMAQAYQCVKAFADAGKICRDSTECHGECLVELVTTCDENGICADSAAPNAGDPATGICQRDDNPCGSFILVREGRAQTAIHRD